MVQRFVAALVLSGMFIASAGGAALASSGPVAAHQGRTHTTPAARQQVRKAARLRRQGARRLAGHAYRVTAVSGNTISALTRAGQPVTITVGLTTTYTEAGVTTPLALSNVSPGELIVVRGVRTAPRTFQASRVRILLTRVGGVVTAVNGSTLTVIGAQGTPRTVTLSATTAITRAGAPAAAAAIAVNSVIVAAGTLNPDGSLTATRIQIRVAHAAGTVTAVSGSTITMRGPYGATYTVSTSGSTVYAARQGRLLTPATAAAVTIGQRIVVYGARGADGATFTAVRIVLGRVTTAKVIS